MPDVRSFIKHVIPLDDEEALVSRAETIAFWFRAAVGTASDEPGAGDRSESLLIDRTTRSSAHRAAARSAMSLLFPASDRRRLHTGPLTLGLTGEETTDADVAAVAAVWSMVLDHPARIVAPDPDTAEPHRTRLRWIGVELTEDTTEWTTANDLIDVAADSETIALVLAASTLDDDVVDASIESEVPLLVVPRLGDRNRSVRSLDIELDAAPIPDPHPGVDRLDPSTCWERLRAGRTGRLGYVDGGWPVIVPVNYRIAGDEVVIRSLPGRKLHAAQRGDVVCLEIDEFDAANRAGWSVSLQGRLEVASEPDRLRRAWADDPGPWADGEDWQWMVISPRTVSGRTASGRTVSGRTVSGRQSPDPR